MTSESKYEFWGQVIGLSSPQKLVPTSRPMTSQANRADLALYSFWGQVIGLNSPQKLVLTSRPMTFEANRADLAPYSFWGQVLGLTSSQKFPGCGIPSLIPVFCLIRTSIWELNGHLGLRETGGSCACARQNWPCGIRRFKPRRQLSNPESSRAV